MPMDPSSKIRRLARKAKIDSKKHQGCTNDLHSMSVSPDTVTGTVTVFKDRKAKNRESAMLSRQRKMMRMKALEDENAQLRNEIFELKRMLYQRNGNSSGNEIESEIEAGTGSWKMELNSSNRKPEAFTVL